MGSRQGGHQVLFTVLCDFALELMRPAESKAEFETAETQ